MPFTAKAIGMYSMSCYLEAAARIFGENHHRIIHRERQRCVCVAVAHQNHFKDLSKPDRHCQNDYNLLVTHE